MQATAARFRIAVIASIRMLPRGDLASSRIAVRMG